MLIYIWYIIFKKALNNSNLDITWWNKADDEIFLKGVKANLEYFAVSQKIMRPDYIQIWKFRKKQIIININLIYVYFMNIRINIY